MSSNDDATLFALAAAVLDGTPVDWDAALPRTSSVGQDVLRRFKSIAAITDVHRGELPTLWGPLRLLERIGQGASGEVYRAWEPRLDREVALKLIPAPPVSSGQAGSSLVEEGRLLARVRHPNVVTIHGAERIDDRIGLWMEYVAGRTLYEIVVAEGRQFRAREVADIGTTLAEAVGAVHAAGLLHRDIKAQNVMMADDGRVVLMDFGAGHDRGATPTGSLVGTPLYLAPELLAGTSAPSVQSDIYSLGVLLYFLLTSGYPVIGQTVADLERAHARGDRRALGAAGRRVPHRLRRIIERAIDRRPDRRHESAERLRHDLATYRAGTTRARPATAAVIASVVVAGAVWEGLGRALDWSRTPTTLAAGVDARVGPYRASRDAANPEADDLYLRGRSLISRRGLENVHRAVELFERALGVDPGFAPAHAGLAIAYAFWSFPHRGISYEKAYPIMRAAADKAIQLDPGLADAHVAKGWVLSYERDWVNAERAFQEAIRLDPSLTQAYTSYSVSTLQSLQRYDDALRLLEGAAQRDPQSLDVLREVGEVQLFAGRYADAVETFRRISEVEPDYPFVQTYLARALTFAGRADEAMRRLEPGSPMLASAYVRTGRRSAAEALATMWMDHPFRLAIVAAALGDTARALDAVERAAASEPHRMGRLLIEPELAALRDHPRIAAIRQAFNLP